ncbi:MAG: ParB/RepB/Spo0J family partition protein [Nitrososphaerales archaeon]|jgi:ParB/RepB/Spo0J family partition protein
MSQKDGKKRNVIEIAKDKLFVGELNARMDIGDLTGLVNSIKDIGIIEPLIVRPTQDKEKFEIIAGRRRYESGKLAGLPTYPCVVQELTDVDALVASLAENMARQTMTIEEEGFQYKKLYDRLGEWSEVARETGQKEQRIKNAFNAYDAFLKTGKLVKKFAPWQAEDALSKTQAQQVGRVINSYDVRRKLSKIPEKERTKVYENLGNAVFAVGPKKTWKVLEEFKKNPTQDLKKLADKVEEEAEPLKLSVYFTAKTAPAIIEEADDRGVSPGNFVTQIVEDYLASKGHKVDRSD